MTSQNAPPDARGPHGVWYEGTAQMALAYHFSGEQKRYQSLLTFLESEKAPDGGMPAVSTQALWTGFDLPPVDSPQDGFSCDSPPNNFSCSDPWLYYRRTHVGATAWLVLAKRGVNPYWLGSKD